MALREMKTEEKRKKLLDAPLSLTLKEIRLTDVSQNITIGIFKTEN